MEAKDPMLVIITNIGLSGSQHYKRQNSRVVVILRTVDLVLI